ncbi:LamG domain-containing protein [Streptomyces sp. NBC_00102]|uniref:LamG domain-containing protein n=1 Tax=Streptomyces sp. NBC_00102 TaxID=2975652 RepID=UPI002B1D7175|nr:LamG domain-containing protein [Streptomyces sp. NBC_00102]
MPDRRRRTTGILAMGCAVAVVLTTGTGAAYAADNVPPEQARISDLLTGTGACATGEAETYFSEPPVLSAVLHDSEADNQPSEDNLVQAEFEAWWTDPSGTEQRLTYTPFTTGMSGFRQVWRMPDEVPANTVVSWHVRADDGSATSAWSSENGGAACRFVYDDTPPEPAVITSPDYSEEGWQDGVGVYGTFVLDSPSADVVSYRYQFTGESPQYVSPAETGGPATVRRLPTKAGPTTLSVSAVDRAGHGSRETSYTIAVQAGRAPTARWTLADPAGSGSAAAVSGADARVGAGVTFGGPAPTLTSLTSTAHLDGGGHGFLTPDAPVVDDGGTFAVSGWARPGRTDRAMTIVSQDAGTRAAFALGLNGGDSAPTWSFTVGGAHVTGGAPETGEWAHLLGVYDAETGLAHLYVNGTETGTPVTATPAEGTGSFQIGRAKGPVGYRNRWDGDLGEIQVHDRVVVPAEATALAHRTPQPRGYWALETAADGASPGQNGGAPLRLSPTGAELYTTPADDPCGLDPDCVPVEPALIGHGHLHLDGETGWAATDVPVVDTGDSFTVSTVVRLADAVPAHPMTVLSLAGEGADALQLRYDPAPHAWQLVVPGSGAGESTVMASYRAMPDNPTRLAVVYDDQADTITLYVDGTAAGAPAHSADGLHGEGPLQVGRSRTAESWGDYLHGDIDEIEVYAGALPGSLTALLGHGNGPLA